MATASTKKDYQRRLFELFDRACMKGVHFSKLSDVDRAVAKAEPVVILKHDIHGLDLDALVAFATREHKMGISGTYLFMPSGHPVTQKHFDFSTQLEAMKAVAGLGHELGLHIDPYFQIHQKERSLSSCLREILDEFAHAGITLTVGNMHGNSRHKHPDGNGYGTMFDLIDEVGRQQDFPVLADVPQESADLIRANRISIRDFGFTHWGDMPVWSTENGFVLTNFMTDNQLGKQGTVEVLTRPETQGAFYLSQVQPPGSRNIGPVIRRVMTGSQANDVPLIHDRIDFDDNAPSRFSVVLTQGGLPMLFLVHPEHYC